MTKPTDLQILVSEQITEFQTTEAYQQWEQELNNLRQSKLNQALCDEVSDRDIGRIMSQLKGLIIAKNSLDGLQLDIHKKKENDDEPNEQKY